MFKKKINKLISTYLNKRTTSMPVLGTMPESSNYNLSNDQIKLMKLKFHKMFGCENEFKIIYEDDNMMSKVNGATGEVKIVTFENGTEEVIIFNYFD